MRRARLGERGTKRQARAGQAMVEFAIAGLLFFLILFGVLDMGRAIFQYNLISHGAREGARLAVIQSYTNTDVIDHVVTTSNGIIGSGDVAISGSRSCSAMPCPTVTVTVTSTFTPVRPLIGALIGGGITMTASSTMVVEL